MLSRTMLRWLVVGVVVIMMKVCSRTMSFIYTMVVAWIMMEFLEGRMLFTVRGALFMLCRWTYRYYVGRGRVVFPFYEILYWLRGLLGRVHS